MWRSGAAARTRSASSSSRCLSTVVLDGVHRVQSQTVEVIFFDPVKRVVDEVLAHRAGGFAVGVDRGAPRRLVPLGEDLRRDGVLIGAVRPEMVVDDVEKDHEPARMRGVDERLQVFRAAISRSGRIRQHAVVAPVPPPGKIADRHDLDAVTPSETRCSSLSIAARKVPSGVKAPICSS